MFYILIGRENVEWRLLVVSEFLWICSACEFHFLDTSWVHSSRLFLLVITNGANAGSVGAKPLLGSVNIVQCQVRLCLVRVRLDLG